MPSRTSLAVKEVIPVCNGSKHSLSHKRLGLLWSQCSFIIVKVPEPLRMIYFASALKMEHLSLWSTKSSLHVYWRKILIFFWGSGRHMVLWYGPWMSLDSWQYFCFKILRAGIMSVHYHSNTTKTFYTQCWALFLRKINLLKYYCLLTMYLIT